MSSGPSNPNPFGVGSTSEGRGEPHQLPYSPSSSAVPSHQHPSPSQQQQQGEGSVRAPNPPEGKKKERQVLRRNQACHQCRRRKLKCDSFRPVCSQCARAQSSFLQSLPPGMAPPTSSEMECVCTYDEMFGPFRKNPNNPSAASPASAIGSRGGQKRERASGGGAGPSSERGVGASSNTGGGGGRERGKSTESEKDMEGWNKARQLEMENFELKRQLQASLQSQPPHPLPSNGYSSSSHHPSYSSHYDQPPSPVAPPPLQPQHLPYYPPPPPPHHSMSMNQASQQQYHLPQLSDPFAPKANFPWSSSFPSSTVTSSYPLSSPGYREEYRGPVDPSLSSNSSLRATASTPPTILEALNIQPPTSSQRLSAVDTVAASAAPPQNDPSSPSTSSAHSGTYLPPLLHPTPGFQPHLHYPFVDSKQQEVFHLPPLASRFPAEGGGDGEDEEEDRKKTSGSGTSEESTKAEFMLDGSTLVVGEDGSAWRKRVEDRSRIWALVGGPEALEKHIEIFNEIAPLLPHVFPPYTTMAQPLSSLANPPPPSAFDSTSPDHPASLLSRVKLPIEDPNSITPALVLAIAAFSVQGTDEGQALAAEAGRQIIFTRLMAISGETMGSAQGRARRALDVAQAACLLVGLYHITGRWAEFHTFASLPLSLCELLGLDPDQPECLPEYTISVLAPPVDDVEAEERRRTIQISRFVGLMCGVCSGRGVIGNYDNGEPNDFSEIISLNPLALSLQSILLLSRVDNFNRSLRPSPSSTSLLSDPETVKKFKGVEATIDTWVALLGSQTGVGTGPSWKGNAGVGELLALKVLAEHARVLLYYVHLDHSTSNSQRQACLSAAQSISQSCVFASTLPVLAIPSYVLHSYFLAGQVLLRFAAAAAAHRDERLLGQLHQQLWSINDTFARLSGVYPVAANMHKLLDAAIREGSSVLPRSLAMHFDSAFYSPF
ncbi:hypothetical protein BDY24DRAFT_403473 [Mrakia frigida]|uniref:uncharacterized protein n=1 Tax=Mrakia frigida TaxID=29902 RepID=UPI003FCC0F2D